MSYPSFISASDSKVSSRRISERRCTNIVQRKLSHCSDNSSHINRKTENLSLNKGPMQRPNQKRKDIIDEVITESDYNNQIEPQSQLFPLQSTITSTLNWNSGFSNNCSEFNSINTLRNSQTQNESITSTIDMFQKNYSNYSSQRTLTKIDNLSKMMLNFFSQNSFTSNIPSYKYDFSKTFDYAKKNYIKELSSLITQGENKEEILSLALGKNDLIFVGTKKGNVIIFDIKQDKLIKLIENPFPKEKNNNQYIAIYSLAQKGDYLLSGFSNGFVILYQIKDDNNQDRNNIILKKLNMFRHTNKSKVIQLKLHIKNENKKVVFYSSDLTGSAFKGKYKKKFIVDKNEYITIFSNNNNVPYYLIDIYPKNYKLIAFGSLEEFKIVQMEKKIIKEIIQLKLSDIKTPPFFLFVNNSFFLTLESVIYIYRITKEENEYKIILSSSITHTYPIKTIGFFRRNTLYILDIINKIVFLDSENKIFINSDDISCDEISFYYNEIVSDIKQNNVIKTYNHTLICSSENEGNLLALGENGLMIKFECESLSEYIRNILNDNDNSSGKWNKLFQNVIEIKNNLHPIYSYSEFEKPEEMIIKEIKDMFISLNLDNIAENEEKIKMFFNFLISIGEKDFLFERIYEIFNSKKILNIYFTTLEPYIINQANYLCIKSENISSFIITLIEYYVNANKKQLLSFLLGHFDYIKLIKETEIFQLILLCRVYFILFGITLIYDKFNSISLCFRVLQNIEEILQYLSQNEQMHKKENFLSSLNDIDIFDDKQVYSFDLITLSSLWYINEIIDKKYQYMDNNNYFINFFTSDLFLKFTCYEGSYVNEYLYIIKKIFALFIPTEKKKNILSLLINKFDVVTQHEKLYYFYLFLIETIAKNDEIDISNELKIKSIVFILSYEITDEREENQIDKGKKIAEDLQANTENTSTIMTNYGEIEEDINKTLQKMDSLTHNDCTLLLKACENTSLLSSKEFIKELLQK